MAASSEERMHRWAKTRERGLRRFMILHGALGWGLPTAVLWLILMRATTRGFDLAASLPLALVLFPLGGLAWGWLVWRSAEKQFKASRPESGPTS